jgi:hypothetical protein
MRKGLVVAGRRHLWAIVILLSALSPARAAAQTTAADLAAALDIPAADIISVAVTPLPDSFAVGSNFRVTPTWGATLMPHAGSTLMVLSTGKAAAANQPGFVPPSPGTNFADGALDPFSNVSFAAPGCPVDQSPNVFDAVILTVQLRVPVGAAGLRFDHNFQTSEYPEWVCGSFNDRFVAYLETPAFTGNIALDPQNHPISVNTSLFTQCVNGGTGQKSGIQRLNTACVSTSELIGTGMDVPRPNDSDGAGTGWLTRRLPFGPAISSPCGSPSWTAAMGRMIPSFCLTTFIGRPSRRPLSASTPVRTSHSPPMHRGSVPSLERRSSTELRRRTNGRQRERSFRTRRL